MGTQRNVLGGNPVIYIIAAGVICLNGLICIDIIRYGGQIINYVINYGYFSYSFAPAGLQLTWGVARLIAGIVCIAAMLLLGIAALVRKNRLISIGMAACALAYLTLIISDVMAQIIYGSNIPSILLNICCMTLYLLLALAMFIDVKEIRRFLVERELLALIVPAVLVLLTLIANATSYDIGFSTVLFDLIEGGAQAGAIIIAAAVLTGAVPEFNSHKNHMYGAVNSQPNMGGNMNNNINGNNNMNAGSDMNTNQNPNMRDQAFNVSASIQPPEGNRSVALVVVFSIITCGIYLLYWVYSVSEMMNRELRTGKSAVVQLLLFIFIPFYSWYWIYMMTENIEKYSRMRGRYNQSSMAVINLIVTIIGLAIVAVALMQDALNKAVGEYEGSNYQQQNFRPAQGYGQNNGPTQGMNQTQPYAQPSNAGMETGYTYVEAELVNAGAIMDTPQNQEDVPQEEPVADTTPEPVENAAVHYEELKKLKSLLDENIITQEEFDQLKKKFL